MKYTITILLLLTTIGLNAQTPQRFRTKSLIAPTTLSFISGASWGLHERTAHHWEGFHATFPKANPQFWNPAVSWKNKYHNGDPELGRKRLGGVVVPVQFTDAKHLLATSNQVFGFAAGCTVFIGEKKPWWHYAVKVGASFIGYSVGNAVTYSWMQ